MVFHLILRRKESTYGLLLDTFVKEFEKFSPKFDAIICTTTHLFIQGTSYIKFPFPLDYLFDDLLLFDIPFFNENINHSPRWHDTFEKRKMRIIINSYLKLLTVLHLPRLIK